MHPANNNVERLSNYTRYEQELDFRGITFPVKLSQIKRFEQLNWRVSVNVYSFNTGDKRIYPVRLTKKVKRNHTHLLLINDDGVDQNFQTPTIVGLKILAN